MEALFPGAVGSAIVMAGRVSSDHVTSDDDDDDDDVAPPVTLEYFLEAERELPQRSEQQVDVAQVTSQ